MPNNEQPEPRWTVETDNPELKAFLIEELTPTLGQISDQALHEAGQRLIYGDHGAECVKAYDEYAAQYRGGVYQPFGDAKPGDIIGWTSDGAAQYGLYGHVEVITPKQARHYRRQTLQHRVRLFLARLADSVRGRK